jgi:hypothetical protein
MISFSSKNSSEYFKHIRNLKGRNLKGTGWFIFSPMVVLSGVLLIPNQVVQLSVVAIHHFQTDSGD